MFQGWEVCALIKFCFDNTKTVFIFQPFLPYMAYVLLFHPFSEGAAFIQTWLGC